MPQSTWSKWARNSELAFNFTLFRMRAVFQIIKIFLPLPLIGIERICNFFKSSPLCEAVVKT